MFIFNQVYDFCPRFDILYCQKGEYILLLNFLFIQNLIHLHKIHHINMLIVHFTQTHIKLHGLSKCVQ